MPQLGRPKFDRVSAPEVEHGLVRPIRYVENRGSAQSPLVGNGLISTSTVSTSCLPPNWSGLQPIFPWATSLGSEAWGSVNSWDQWPKARGDETGNYRTYRPVFFVGVGELGRPWRLRSCRCFSGWKSGDPGTGIWSEALEVSDVFGHDGCDQLFGGSQILHEAGSTDQEGGVWHMVSVWRLQKLPRKKAQEYPRMLFEDGLCMSMSHVTNCLFCFT